MKYEQVHSLSVLTAALSKLSSHRYAGRYDIPAVVSFTTLTPEERAEKQGANIEAVLEDRTRIFLAVTDHHACSDTTRARDIRRHARRYGQPPTIFVQHGDPVGRIIQRVVKCIKTAVAALRRTWATHICKQRKAERFRMTTPLFQQRQFAGCRI
jgi:hypothetical protein